MTIFGIENIDIPKEINLTAHFVGMQQLGGVRTITESRKDRDSEQRVENDELQQFDVVKIPGKYELDEGMIGQLNGRRYTATTYLEEQCRTNSVLTALSTIIPKKELAIGYVNVAFKNNLSTNTSHFRMSQL
ncbi:hypothetical protein T265_07787 [Opisthorchis viverrini]|uniref:Uncharacterized protein n=2 Tax=Opisthorchis viverrini TaxID=6198 RepID=A0A075AAK2_OPIVI|nr:hypothetical protein T265_07787 [Opisthorchis viverrini]KER24594.1 hypothetical protein T265_07787 [Opisthorchis viverrini]